MRPSRASHGRGSELVWVDIQDHWVLTAYAEIDHWSATTERMGKNDVRIAAVCTVTGATLLTSDKGFDQLHESWIRRIWVDEMLGRSK